MVRSFSVCAFFLLLVCSNAILRGEDNAELEKLRTENARLKVELVAATARIAALEKQLEAIPPGEGNQGENPVDDLLVVGSVWSGSRFYKQQAGLAAQPWTMKITERNGKKFKAKIAFTAADGLKKELTVTGTAPVTTNGEVAFKTEQRAIFQQSFRGVLAGGQLALEFDGTSVAGTRVFGTGDLKREAPKEK